MEVVYTVEVVEALWALTMAPAARREKTAVFILNGVGLVFEKGSQKGRMIEIQVSLKSGTVSEIQK